MGYTIIFSINIHKDRSFGLGVLFLPALHWLFQVLFDPALAGFIMHRLILILIAGRHIEDKLEVVGWEKGT